MIFKKGLTLTCTHWKGAAVSPSARQGTGVAPAPPHRARGAPAWSTGGRCSGGPHTSTSASRPSTGHC